MGPPAMTPHPLPWASTDIQHDNTGHNHEGPAGDDTQPVGLEYSPLTRHILYSPSLTEERH